MAFTNYTLLASVAAVALGLACVAQSACGQEVASPVSVHELIRRLEATEQRLMQTESRLVDTESELQTLRHRNHQPNQWPTMHRIPPSESLHHPAGYAVPQDSEYLGCDDCPDCGKSVCPGIPHLCESCLEDLGWNKAGGWRVIPFGKLELETVFATDTAVSENYIVFAATRGQTKTERIDLTGQSSQIGLNIGGPTLGAFQIGGLILMDFHGNRPSRNEPGAYFIRAYAELVSDNWRIALGQMGDTIGGWNAETVNWPGIGGLGFLGANQRGTIRVDRYLYPSDTVQWTITGALTEPVATDLAGINDAVGQDNGLPNFEGQIVLGLGPDCGEERPLQFSLSGMYGEYFAAALNLPMGLPGVSNTSQAYAVSGAVQWTSEIMGVRGQLWQGRGLGTYMGGISQSLNTETGETIRATGGFGQVWLNVTERIKVSAIAGIDDPTDGDLSVMDNQRARNRLIGGNIFVNITDYFHVGLDVWHVETDYALPASNNDIVVMMTEATITY